MTHIRKYLLIIAFGLALTLILFPFYRDGKMISGWEGGYFLDFPSLWQNFGYSWYNSGAGIIASSLNFGYVSHLALFQILIPNERIINFIMIYFLYFLPFLVVYLLSLELKITPWVALLISIFYITNPFVSNFMKSINQWNMLAAYVLPSFFLIIFKFYNKNFLLFFLFGLNSLFFAFTNANPPTMILYQIAIVFFVFFTSLHKEQKLNFKSIIKNYFTVIFSFFLFNFWWIINWFYILPDAGQGYSKEFAISWLRGAQMFIPAFWRTLNLTSLLQYPLNPEYDYFAKHYSYFFTPILLSIPILIIIYFLFKKRLGEKHHLVLGLMLIIIGFLSKGVNGLFGRVYEFMVMNFPFFSIFKSAEEKWGTLFIFLLTLYLIFIFKELKKDRVYQFMITFFIIYVMYSAVPFLTGNFLPDYKYNEQVIGSKRFLDKTEYQNLRRQLNNDPLQYRVLSLPGSWNYQVALQIAGKRFYTGNDPVLSNTNKAFIAPYNGTFTERFGVLFDSISKPDYLNLLGLYNIKKIVINKDMYPWFGFQPKESVPEMEAIFDKNLTSSKNQAIDLYDVGDYFLPRFYIPNKVVYSPLSAQEDLPGIVSFKDFSQRSAIFLSPGTKTDERKPFENNLVKTNSQEVVLVGDIQSAVDESILRAGVEGMNPGGVLFPYVRWKPGSFIYPYIQRKEQKAKDQVRDNQKLLFEQHLLFAAKRISEIQKWDLKLDEKAFDEVLERYQKEMVEAIENLNTIRSEGEDTFILLAKIEVSFEAHSKRLQDILSGDYLKEENEKVKFADSILNDVDKKLKETIKEYQQTKYYFEIPQEGEYEILTDKSGKSLGWKIENTSLNQDEKFIASMSGQQNDDRWLSYGKRLFNKGNYFLTLIPPPVENLLTTSWEGTENMAEVGDEVKLFGQKNIYQEIKRWQPSRAYKLLFKYKTDLDLLKTVLVEEDGKVDTTWFDKGILDNPPVKTRVLVDASLRTGGNWNTFETVVNSSRNATSAKLFFTTTSGREGFSSAELKEVKIEPIVEPLMILKMIQKDYSSVPKITFNKINPTKYVIDIEDATDPYYLVFSESFHRGWKAYIDISQKSKIKSQNDTNQIVASYFTGEINERKPQNIFLDQSTFETWGKRPLPDDRHIVMNGYANSWFITPQDSGGQTNYRIVVEYWPQQLFYIGLLVTALAILSTFTVGLVKILKPR